MLNKRGRPSYEIIGDTTGGSGPTAIERAAGGDACIALRASAPPYTLGGGGKTDWFAWQHVKYDCTEYQEARVVADMVTSGTGTLGVDFALDDVTFTAVSYDGDAQLTLGAAGTIAGTWMTLKDVCIGDCYFRWWTVSGDGQVGNVYLQFRGSGNTRRSAE